jgi:anti-sigma factor RsiW
VIDSNDMETPDGKPCPSQGDVATYVAGDLRPEDEQRVRRHLVECADCLCAVAMYVRLVAEEVTPEERDEAGALHRATAPLVLDLVYLATKPRPT